MKVSKSFAITIATIFHFVVTVFFFFFYAGMVMAAFDGKRYGMMSYKVISIIFEVLSFPLVWADNLLHIMFRILPGPAYWLLYLLNSLIWGWFIVSGFIWWRRRKGTH